MFHINLKDKEMKIIKVEISVDENDSSSEDQNSFVLPNHFNKCIGLSNNKLAISNDKLIIIFIKDNNDEYFLFKRIKSFSRVKDFLLVNNEYSITSLPADKKLYFLI